YMDARIDARKLRIWCAAASSGQEPYSLAMILSELGAMVSGWNIEILGTDISTGILEKAEEGLYSQFEVQRGLPVQFLVKYFEKEDEVWRIKNDIRSMVKYRKFNLLDDLKSLGRFDIVFCRNVLIYFDQETKTKILAEIAELMPDDGLLFLGGAETVLGISDLFRPIPKLRGV
ncbi:MAG: protein-glutamate O-methyltransferase CheR, partial [Rhodospirillales bacterium]|nr:protein-glutamate O-methyltransferase CheR [Rhodospirillales bacterium]